MLNPMQLPFTKRNIWFFLIPYRFALSRRAWFFSYKRMNVGTPLHSLTVLGLNVVVTKGHKRIRKSD